MATIYEVVSSMTGKEVNEEAKRLVKLYTERQADRIRKAAADRVTNSRRKIEDINEEKKERDKDAT